MHINIFDGVIRERWAGVLGGYGHSCFDDCC